MNILVAYATAEGQTAAIARRIGAALAQDGHVARVLDLKDDPIDLAPFDVIIAGGSIHTGTFSNDLGSFVTQNLDVLRARHSAFFSVSLAEADTTGKGHAQVQLIIAAFIAQHRWTPDTVRSFAGSLKYTKYNPLIRFIMKRISKQYGGDTDTHRDYEYTDWAAVDAFAQEVGAAGLGSSLAGPGRPG